jgi:hypothetical protein
MISLEFKSKSPLLPSIDIKLYDYQLSQNLTESLRDIVLAEELNILQSTPIYPDEKDPTWLTGRLWHYNFLNFDYPEIKELKQTISDQYNTYMESLGLISEPVYIQCWANIIRNNGRIITPHNHSSAHTDAPAEYCYMSGNITIQAENTATIFANPFLRTTQWIPVPNNNGEMILFPSFVVHWTTPNESETPRVTISFDIITEHVYNISTNHNFIKL